jgi:hypothetical protein
MVFITKTVYIGSDENKTTEINESTTIEFAEICKSRSINRWYNILIGTNDYHEYILPDILMNIINSLTGTNEEEFRFEIIMFSLNMENKYTKPNTLNSFSIEIYEENS